MPALTWAAATIELNSWGLEFEGFWLFFVRWRWMVWVFKFRKHYHYTIYMNKVGFRNFSGFRNWDSETLSLDSETLSLDSETFASDSKTFSPDSETLSSETFSLDSETLFVGFRNFFRRIQKLFSSDSESLFVGFRNCFRRIQKLFSSDSETLFVGFRNSFRPMLSMITTFLLSKISPPSPWQPNPCFQWLLHSFHQNLTPPPWQPMLSMIQVQVLHSFYQDFYIPFIKISPFPLWQPNPCCQWLLHSFYQNLTQPLGNPCFQWFRFKYYISFIKIFTFLLSTFPLPPWQPNPCCQWLLHSFYQNFSPPLSNPTHAFNDYYIPFIKIWPPPPLGNPCFQWFRFKYYIPLSRFLHLFYQHFPSPPLATQPMLSMITTFLLSKFPLPWQPNPCFQWLLHSFYQNLTPPPWQPMLSMIQVQVLHSFYQDFYIPFIKISPFPLWQPNPCCQWLLHSFYQNFLPPLATQPMLSMIHVQVLHSFHQDFYIPFIKISPLPRWQPNPCCQWLLHSFYQNFSPPLATKPMHSMITTFLLSKFLPPLGNPCFQWFMCKYYIPLIKIFTFLWSKFDPPPLGNLCFQWFWFKYYIPFIKIFTFLLSTFPPPPWQPNPCFQWLLHSFYQNFAPPLGNPTHAFNDYYIPFIKIPPPLG